MNSTLRINCYVRIKASGYVGRLGSIYRDEDTRRRSYGVDWASEFKASELERISPAEYHASPGHLKLAQNNREHSNEDRRAGQLDTTIVFNSKTGKYHAWTGKQFIGAYDTILAAGQELLKRGGNGSPTVYG